MGKAEKRACEYTGYCRNKSYDDYLNGYKQAEKDLALTLEDLQLICKIEFSICCYEYKGKKLPPEEQIYKEILKRFKDCKEREEK